MPKKMLAYTEGSQEESAVINTFVKFVGRAEQDSQFVCCLIDDGSTGPEPRPVCFTYAFVQRLYFKMRGQQAEDERRWDEEGSH